MLALLPLLSCNKIPVRTNGLSSKINQPDTYPYGFAITTSFQTDATSFVPEIRSAARSEEDGFPVRQRRLRAEHPRGVQARPRSRGA